MTHNNNTTQLFAHPLSESDLEPVEWTTVKFIQLAIFSSGVLGAILGNFLALYAFLRYRRELRYPTHYFLANLALADFLVGILTLPFLTIFSVTLRWYFGQTFCYLWTILHFCFCSGSILSTLAVCVERYLGVSHPLTHLRLMTNRNIGIALIGVWILAGILSAAPLLVWQETPSTKPLDCRVNLRTGHVLVASIGIFHIPASAMVILYLLIYRTVTSTSSEFKGEGARSHGKSDQYKTQVRLALKLSFLVGFLIVSYLPMFTVFLMLGFNPTIVPLEVFIMLAWLRYFNSSINPLIYAFSIPGYKNAFRKMFFRKRISKSGNSVSLSRTRSTNLNLRVTT